MKETDKSAVTKPEKDKYGKIIAFSYPRQEIEADFPDPVLRAAQFAPFEALTGHEDAIEETARATASRRIPDEYAAEELERKIRFLSAHQNSQPEISITYFIPDSKKPGGEYKTVKSRLLKIKEYEKLILLADGTEISTPDIIEIEGRIFDISH